MDFARLPTTPHPLPFLSAGLVDFTLLAHPPTPGTCTIPSETQAHRT